MTHKEKIRGKIATALYGGLALGALSSNALADGSYYTFSPNSKPDAIMLNQTIPSWKGLNIGFDYSSADTASKYKDSIGILQDQTVKAYFRKASIGYDFQDGTLVYGFMLSGEDYRPEGSSYDTISKSIALSTVLRSGFTLDNANSSIFQNTLFYGFGGMRAKGISANALCDGKFNDVTNNITKSWYSSMVDYVAGAGIEKKITSFASLRAEYRYVFSNADDLKDYSSILKYGRVSTGLFLRF